jgi:hypothetical protein
MHIAAKDALRIQGKIKIQTYRSGMVELATPRLEEIRLFRDALRQESNPHYAAHLRHRLERAKLSLDAIKQAFFLDTPVESRNLVMDSPGYGLDLIIQRLVGNNTYSLNITWIEIGTGVTTPTVNDTALTTPSVRLPISYQEDFGATDAILQAYVSDANLPNATYGEVGSFVDGTSTIGSGQLFNHALLSPTYSKVSGQDTTIQIDFTLMNF